MATKKKTDVNSELRIGIIGCGGRGCVVKNAHGVNGGKVVAVCDIRDEALKHWDDYVESQKHLFKNPEKLYHTKDYRKILDRKDVDAVFVTVPDFLHEEYAIAALKAGKTVYLEKPMAITIEGCDRILRTAMETGSKLFVGHNMRHMDYVNKMRELIQQGVIGNLQICWCRHFISYGGDAYFKDWHSEQKNTTSLLLQKGAHDIDVIHWLSGGYTKRVVGMGKLSVYNRCPDRRSPDVPGVAEWNADNWPPLTQKRISPIIDVEDSSTIMMELDNGVQANYMQCHYTPDECRNYTFIGDEGRIENIGSKHIAIYTKRAWNNFNDPDQLIRLPDAAGGHGGADPDIIANFVLYAKGEKKVASNNPIAARNSVAVGVKASWSIRHGNIPMDIEFADKKLIKYFEGGQKKRSK